MPSGVTTQTAVLLSLACLACGGSEDATRETQPPDVGTTAKVVVDLRVGVAEGDAEYRFGRIIDVAATPNGTIFVANRPRLQLRRYDSDGRFLGHVGRRGEGRDEYSDLLEVEATPDGRIVVHTRRGQFLVYGEDGSQLSYFGIPHANPGLVAGSDGALYVPAYSSTDTPDRVTGRRRDSFLLRLSEDEERLVWRPLPHPEPSHLGGAVPRVEGTLEPFTVKTMYAWSPLGYLVTGRSDEYSLHVDVPDGPPVQVGREVSRAPLEGPERDAWLAMLRKVQRVYEPDTSPGGGMRWVQRAEEDNLPELKPYFRDIQVDDDGRIWVHRYVEADLWDPAPEPPQPGMTPLTWREPPTFDVFAPDGTFLGTVVLPRLTRFTQIRGDTLWGVQEDFDTGHQYVVRMRLEPSLGDW